MHHAFMYLPCMVVGGIFFTLGGNMEKAQLHKGGNMEKAQLHIVMKGLFSRMQNLHHPKKHWWVTLITSEPYRERV